MIGLNNKKTNEYDLSGEYGIGYTARGKKFYFDLEDYETIKDYCWTVSKKGYIENLSKERGTGKNIRTSIHRLIMRCPEGMVVDHVGGHGTENDNRKANLRIVTLSENSQNTKLRKNNSTGCNGVCFNKDSGKYRAGIMVKRKYIFLGYFTELSDAIVARKSAEDKYYGDHSYDRSQEIYREGVMRYSSE